MNPLTGLGGAATHCSPTDAATAVAAIWSAVRLLAGVGVGVGTVVESAVERGTVAGTTVGVAVPISALGVGEMVTLVGVTVGSAGVGEGIAAAVERGISVAVERAVAVGDGGDALAHATTTTSTALINVLTRTRCTPALQPLSRCRVVPDIAPVPRGARAARLLPGSDGR